MSKFSVKKPLTVFVAVIAVLVLGVVAYLKMTPDLLPNMDFPYVMIMTTYPGASPEEVEQEITKPMEQAMSTLENIKEVTSTSAENYSMVLLEFEEDVNMDTIGVDIQQNISMLSSGWDEMVSAPYVLKINPSLLPVMVAAVSMDGKDTIELTQYLDEELMGKLEGIAGVARISTSGTVTQQLHVVLDQNMIDALNKSVSNAINGKMDEALGELQETKEQLVFAQQQMEVGKQQLETGKDQLLGQTAAGEAELSYQQAQLVATRGELVSQLGQIQSGKTQLEAIISVIEPLMKAIQTLQTEADGIAADIEVLLGLLERAEALEKQWQQMQQALEEIRNDTSLTPEEAEKALAQITGSQEYQQLQANLAQLEALLKAYGVTREEIPQRVEVAQAALADIRQRIENIRNLLTQQGIDPDSVGQQLEEMKNNIALMEQGIAAIEDGIAQIDGGMLQLKEAQALLSEQKAAGLLELAAAATEISVNSATVTGALTQIDGGIGTLETTREQTLASADLNNIITMEMLTTLLTAQNFSMPAGTISQDGVNYMLSVGDEISTLEELQNLLLFDMGMEGVAPIYLKDVAAVMVTDNSAQSYAKLDGLDSIMLTFEKQSTFATAETTDNILERFEELEKEHPGLKFVSMMNQGDYIYLIVETILSSLLLGALFAILVLFLFLWDLRPTFITLCSIPISVIFAIVLMYFSGVTINMISLSGLAVSVGMLVDNSVVVIENIYRLRAKGANAIQAAVSGAKQVAGAVVASTLTTVCVFLPIVFVEGITKQLFTDLALTMTFSLLASLIVALTLVPAMASGMLRKQKDKEHKLMDRLNNAYGKGVTWALKHKAIVLGVSAALLVGSMVLSLSKGYIFMPEMDMPNVNVTVSMPEDATMEEAVELADEVLNRIDTLDGIASAGAMMGSSGLMGGATGGQYDVTVYITLADESASGAEVGKKITELCADMPCEVTASSAMMDMSMLSGSGIAVEIYAEDMQALQAAAEKAADALAKVDGVKEVDNGLGEQTPAIHVSVDRNAAMSKGITVAQIYMELAAALQTSSTAATLNIDGENIDVIIDKPEGAVLTVDQLESYPFEVTTQTGAVNTFTLGEVATIEQTVSLNSISRLAQRRYITVSATLEEGKNVTLATAEAEKIMKKLDLGSGVTYEFAGENETIMEAVEQLILMLLLGVLLVYLVMVAQFQSLKSPFIVMFTIPLAFTGGFIALLLCGMEISVISLIGFVMLTGIIVNNGIVLVDYINQLRLEGMERREAIVEAGRTRMRPILMTTITTVLGLVDMAVRQNVGTALMQPVAVVCIGGLVYATLMTLFVVPCIYDMLNKKELRKVRDEDLELLDI